VLEQEAHTLLVEVSAVAIPEALQISVEGVEAITHLPATEVVLPEGAVLVSDPETLVVSVVLPTVAPSDDEEAAEAPAAAAAEAPAEGAAAEEAAE
jgi:large subunit ribosomal protein L25